jgi:hypothetical protein
VNQTRRRGLAIQRTRTGTDLLEGWDPWAALLIKSASTSLFLTWQWLCTWWKDLAEDDERVDRLLARKKTRATAQGQLQPS